MPEELGDERWAQGASVQRPAGGEALQGLVERVTFHDPRSLYTVLKLSPERGFADPGGLFSVLGERVTAVGNTSSSCEGLRVRLLGRWTVHKEHGRQFQFDALTVLPALVREGLIRYFASKAFPGVGPTLATRIVDQLGTNALAAIRADPAVLARVPGLRESVRDDLAARVRDEIDAQELLAFLLGCGLYAWQAQAVLEKYGRACEPLLRANPYLLARGIPGIGFATADRVARELGLAVEAPERREAGILHALALASADGHTLLPAGELLRETCDLLGFECAPEAFEDSLERLEREGELVIERGLAPEAGPLVYTAMLFACESGLAQNLARLRSGARLRPLAPEIALSEAEARAAIELHHSQRSAALGLLEHPLALLTGGPGVGKTTLLRLFVDVAESAQARVLLASPTGRAAKRLSEATGREASTLHRLLGWDPREQRFQRDARNPLQADLVVVDEVSMLDVALAHHLLKAIEPPTRLVLVGDPDQLPSVGPGNVLADLIACGRIPLFRLSHVFRQAHESLIVHNSHRILAGEMPEFAREGSSSTDFYFFPAEDEEATAERLVEVVTDRIPARFELAWERDVQVLAPMYRGAAGVDALNERLRAALDVRGPELAVHGRTLRLGDRVIQTRNDYEKEVFNGDMGRIESIDTDGSGLEVRFPERVLHYTREELGDLQPAFAITVHRSQGGEFPAVVMPLVMQHALMLERNLLYTAVTRAKRLVVLVGSARALRRAVENAEPRERRSALAARLLRFT